MLYLENGARFAYERIGEFHTAGSWIHPRRIIDSFELIVVLEGTVHLAEETTRYALQKNQMLLLEPGKEHYGYQTTSDPTAFYWLHMQTTLPPPLKLYTGPESYEIKQDLKRLLHITNTPAYSAAAADAASFLVWEELCRLADTNAAPIHLLGAKLIEAIRLNSHRCLTISNLAHTFGYTADYLGAYFKKCYGIGLKEYIAAQKIRLAKDLLLTTNQSVKQIAHALGYQEENRFIKFFQYHEAISPAAFRTTYCNTHQNHR